MNTLCRSFQHLASRTLRLPVGFPPYHLRTASVRAPQPRHLLALHTTRPRALLSLPGLKLGFPHSLLGLATVHAARPRHLLALLRSCAACDFVVAGGVRVGVVFGVADALVASVVSSGWD